MFETEKYYRLEVEEVHPEDILTLDPKFRKTHNLKVWEERFPGRGNS